jgi:hypothetical protein
LFIGITESFHVYDISSAVALTRIQSISLSGLSIVSQEIIFDLVATPDFIYTASADFLVKQWKRADYELLKTFTGTSL